MRSHTINITKEHYNYPPISLDTQINNSKTYDQERKISIGFGELMSIIVDSFIAHFVSI